MRENKIVQFVCFETILDKEQFIVQWEQFTRPANIEEEIILQQSEKNGLFRYIAQYRCATNEFEFVFIKARRSPHSPAVPIKIDQMGGYSILQFQRTDDVKHGETKVFGFVMHSGSDLNIYRQICPSGKLNIYEAYYENCRYSYILEFFVKDQFAGELLRQLKQHDVSEIRVYKECAVGIS